MVTSHDFRSIAEALGLPLSFADIRTVFSYFDKDHENKVYIDFLLDETFKAHDSSESDFSLERSSSPNKMKLKRNENNFNHEHWVISSQTRDDIGESVRHFLKSSNDACFGKLLVQLAELKGGSITAMTRKQMRRVFIALGTQLTDQDETTIFDYLDFKSDETINIHDLILFCFDLAYLNDNLEASYALRRILEKKKMPPKEFSRTLSKANLSKSGYLEDVVFQKLMAKIYGMETSITKFEEIEDLIKFFDPNKEGRIDIEYVTALAMVCIEPSRSSLKLKNMLNLLKSNDIDFKDILFRNLDSCLKDGMISIEDLSTAFTANFALPILPCEINSIASQFQRRNKINLESFLEKILGTKNDLSASGQQNDRKNLNKGNLSRTKDSSQSSGSEFGKNLFKKIFKLRANSDKRFLFRSAILSKDSDMNGYINKRDLQRLLDGNQYIDLSDEESCLLIENLLIKDSSNIDYSLLLLFLNEPVSNPSQIINAGVAIVKKLNRDTDLISLTKNINSKCCKIDTRYTGMIPTKSIIKIMHEICIGVDLKSIQTVLLGFKDSKSDCVLYIELLSFLSNCSIWDVMNRIQRLELIRQKQGYDFQEFLLSYTQKKGKLVDASKFNELSVSLGIFIPETGISTIFTLFCLRSNCNSKSF